jgi:hypothetical protein
MILYLVDLFGDLAFGLAEILDIVESPPGTGPLAGNFIVRVPEGLSVQKPLNLGDLITKKYSAMLALYSSFTRVAFDALLDTADVATADPASDGMFGSRSNIRVNQASYVRSGVVVLAGLAPAQALITWETFTITETDPENGTITRTYQEVPSDSAHITCQVSFDSGVTFLAALDGMVLNIPLINQGTNFMIRLTNTSGAPINVGSWALLY